MRNLPVCAFAKKSHKSVVVQKESLDPSHCEVWGLLARKQNHCSGHIVRLLTLQVVILLNFLYGFLVYGKYLLTNFMFCKGTGVSVEGWAQPRSATPKIRFITTFVPVSWMLLSYWMYDFLHELLHSQAFTISLVSVMKPYILWVLQGGTCLNCLL